jgi:hypothetical protein
MGRVKPREEAKQYQSGGIDKRMDDWAKKIAGISHIHKPERNHSQPAT